MTPQAYISLYMNNRNRVIPSIINLRPKLARESIAWFSSLFEKTTIRIHTTHHIYIIKPQNAQTARLENYSSNTIKQ